jgi:hypothetical protein
LKIKKRFERVFVKVSSKLDETQLKTLLPAKWKKLAGNWLKLILLILARHVVFVMNQPRKRLNYPKEYMNAGIVGKNQTAMLIRPEIS